jgi:lipopolysaccharide biosynthesis glycosyltransferase
MDDTNRNNLTGLSNRDNISIRCHDISANVSELSLYTESNYTETTYRPEVYYRLLIPSLMPDYDKVLYMDGDMVALKDLFPISCIELGGALIGATRDYCGIAACYDKESDRKTYRETILGDYCIDEYVISCLILFNVKQFNNEYDGGSVLSTASSRKWLQHDQDVINVLCKGKIQIIDPKWAYFEETDYTSRFLPERLREEYRMAYENPAVIHYAAENKVWMNRKSRFNDPFWDAAYRTPFFDIFNGRIGNDVLYRYHIFHDVLHLHVGYYYTFDSVVLVSEPQLIGSMKDLEMHLTKIDLKRESIQIYGFFENISYNNSDPILLARINGCDLPLETTPIPSDRVSGSSVFIFSFHYELKEDTRIRFRITYDGIHNIDPTYVCVDQFTPINENKKSYYINEGWCLKKIDHGKELHIFKSADPFSLEHELRTNLKELGKKNVLKYRRITHILKKVRPTNKIIFFIDSEDRLNDIPEIERIYPGLKITAASTDKIPGTIDVMSSDYQVSFTLADIVVATVYNYYAFFPFTSFTRSDEVRDLLANKKHILFPSDRDFLKILGNRNYKVDGLILRKSLVDADIKQLTDTEVIIIDDNSNEALS